MDLKITENKLSKGRILLIVLLSVIFLFLSFSLNTSIYLTFALAVAILVIGIVLTQSSIKKLDFFSLLIYLIPVASLGLFYAISNFSKEYYSIGDRVMFPLIMIIFSFSGVLLKNLRKNEIKYIFAGLLLGLAVVSIINLSLTLYHYGPFHTLKYETYYLYYNGASSKETMSGIAYALCGFTFKNVPIEYYLMFPSLLLTGSLFCLANGRKNIFNLCISIISITVSLISFIFVINKITVATFIIVLVINGLLLLLFVPKIRSNKVFKIVSLIPLGLFFIMFVFAFLNAQSNIPAIHNLTKSNAILNYVFNTNRYISSINVVLNGVFSREKIIGFPLLFDEAYELISYPSNNIFINQFMYGGIFAFLFFIILFVVIFYNFRSSKDKYNEDKGSIFPFAFIMMFLAFSFISDTSLIDEFDFAHYVFTPTNPFFLVTLLCGGIYASNMKKGVKKDEE